jgi:oxygen-independent coproporphyrinogen-3 oxidase
VPERISLYVHVPFCEKKCGYCSFNSHVPKYGEKRLWLEAVKSELALYRRMVRCTELATLYIGGGTPTTLSVSEMEELFDSISLNFKIADDAEATVEANPNSLRAEHLILWRDTFINRVSIGVQSFDDAELSFMGRLHSAGEAYESVAASLAAGFNVSLDLIFGLPWQTLHGWGRTLKDAVKSGVHHISLYQLSIEPGTPFEELDRALLPDGYEHYRWAQWYLPRKGYEQYEISNFARVGRESRHNLNYWREGEYIGVGPGASGYIDGLRYKNISDLASYAERVTKGESAAEFSERLIKEDLSRESAVLALRTTEGLSRSDYAARFGRRALEGIDVIASRMPKDLFVRDGDRFALSPKGMRVANLIWAEII